MGLLTPFIMIRVSYQGGPGPPDRLILFLPVRDFGTVFTRQESIIFLLSCYTVLCESFYGQVADSPLLHWTQVKLETSSLDQLQQL